MSADLTARKPGTHSNFKVIVNGRELPFPIMRIIAICAIGFVWGFATGALYVR